MNKITIFNNNSNNLYYLKIWIINNVCNIVYLSNYLIMFKQTLVCQLFELKAPFIQSS